MRAALAALALFCAACPKAEPAFVVVDVAYPGASALDVEQTVTVPLERALSSVAGVERMTSTSSEGACRVKLRVGGGDGALDSALGDAHARLGAVLTQLPSSASQPVLSRVDPDAPAAMRFRARGELAPRDATAALDEVVRRVERVAGVGRVDIEDGVFREVRVDVDVARATALGLSVVDIADAVRGAATSDTGTLARIVVRASPEVRVVDVAQVVDGVRAVRPAVQPSGSQADAVRAPGLAVWKQSGAGLAAMQRDVLGALGAAPLPPGLVLDRERPKEGHGVGVVVTAEPAGAPDTAALHALGAAIAERARAIAGVLDVAVPPGPAPRTNVVIDRERAAARGVDASAIARALRVGIGGELVAPDIRVGIGVGPTGDVAGAQSSLTVHARTDGVLVPLADVVTVVQALEPPVLQRRNQARAVVVCVTAQDERTADDVMRQLAAPVAGARVEVARGCE